MKVTPILTGACFESGQVGTWASTTTMFAGSESGQIEGVYSHSQCSPVARPWEAARKERDTRPPTIRLSGSRAVCLCPTPHPSSCEPASAAVSTIPREHRRMAMACGWLDTLGSTASPTTKFGVHPHSAQHWNYHCRALPNMAFSISDFVGLIRSTAWADAEVCPTGERAGPKPPT